MVAFALLFRIVRHNRSEATDAAITLRLQKQDNSTPIPFGPYLAIAGWIVWNGKRPGSSLLVSLSPSPKLVPRFCQVTPVSGRMTPEPNSQYTL